MVQERGIAFPGEISPAEVSRMLEGMDVDERIAWLFDSFNPAHIVFTTSGGDTSAIIPSLIAAAARNRAFSSPLHFVFVDTGLYGKTTYDIVETLRQQGERNGYVLHTYGPRVPIEEMNRLYPQWGTYGSQDFAAAQYLLEEGAT